MSPTEVRARTSTVSVGRLGRVGGVEPLRTLPNRVLTSSQAAVPSRMPTSRSPICGLEHDRAAHDLAEPDVAVGGLGGDAGVRPVDGDVAVGRVDPQVAGGPPTQVSPLEFLTTALPSSSPRRTSPEPVVTSAWPVDARRR